MNPIDRIRRYVIMKAERVKVTQVKNPNGEQNDD